MNTLERAAAKASPRRFSAEPISGFGDLDEAQQVAVLIRDMRDPTHEQLKTMLGELMNRVDAMHRSGHYTGMDVLGERIDAAYDALDGVSGNADGVQS